MTHDWQAQCQVYIERIEMLERIAGADAQSYREPLARAEAAESQLAAVRRARKPGKSMHPEMVALRARAEGVEAQLTAANGENTSLHCQVDSLCAQLALTKEAIADARREHTEQFEAKWAAEAQLATARKILQQAPDTQDPDPDELEAIVDAFSDVRDALTPAPSPGAGNRPAPAHWRCPWCEFHNDARANKCGRPGCDATLEADEPAPSPGDGEEKT